MTRRGSIGRSWISMRHSAEAASPAFVEGFVMDWTASPYTLGSYSYPAPGTRPTSGPTMREVLAQPVGTTLYFAGEATHNTAASTLPGALQSGERAGGERHRVDAAPSSPTEYPDLGRAAIGSSGLRLYIAGHFSESRDSSVKAAACWQVLN